MTRIRMIRVAANRRPLPGERRRGAILSAVMILGMMMLAMAGGVVVMSLEQTRSRARYEIYKDEFAACEVALNKAFAQMQFLIEFGTPNFDAEVAKIVPPTVAGYEFPHFEVVRVFAGNELINDGQWSGMTLYRRLYRIDVTARKVGGTAERFDNEGVSLSQNLEITYVPLFVYAIFYDSVMEIAPGPPMVVNGLVHANGDAYFQSNESLTFMKNVTIAGNVYHGRHSDSGQTNSGGAVKFTKNGVQVSMQRGNEWLSSKSSDWAVASSERFGDGLRNRDHGVRPLSLPIPSMIDPHPIIERASPDDGYSLRQEKFEYKAGMKILREADGTIRAVDNLGNPVPLTYPDPKRPQNTKSIVSETTFWDAREERWVQSLDINLANMVESGIKPANGILYVSTEDSNGNMGVVRLKNGSRLPASQITGGFTVATDDPIYIQGDFNTVNKTLAMVAADSLNILSNAWNDANSNKTMSTYRKASQTTVNAVCISGIVPSKNNHYSGGVENYFRFLEYWTGVDFNFSGSIIQMWESQKATGYWGKSNVYEAPKRNWSWDNALGGLNGPPGAPRVVELRRTAWKMPAST